MRCCGWARWRRARAGTRSSRSCGGGWRIVRWCRWSDDVGIFRRAGDRIPGGVHPGDDGGHGDRGAEEGAGLMAAKRVAAMVPELGDMAACEIAMTDLLVARIDL